MEFFSQIDVGDLISRFGYLGVFALIFFECAGVPLPGELALVSAAIIAGASDHLRIDYVVGAAAGAAILGDNLGFWVGRRFGTKFLTRYGPYIRLTGHRIKIGHILFDRHGGKVVFFGRFTALLRTYAALLAGANRLPPRRFFLWNASGGLTWAATYGFGAYYFGQSVLYFAREASIGLSVAVVIGIGVLIILFRKHEQQWLAEAERVSGRK
jgi:membrane protein DedA with SNARE-associated domain